MLGIKCNDSADPAGMAEIREDTAPFLVFYFFVTLYAILSGASPV